MTMKHCRCNTRGRFAGKRNSDTTIFYNGPVLAVAIAANLLHALGYLKLSSLGSSTNRTTLTFDPFIALLHAAV